MGNPNLFMVATSELSQDAFITWLLQWADSRYSDVDNKLHSCACKFVRSLLGEPESFKIDSVEAGRQWEKIDVWAFINEKYFLVIEDKKGTKEHSQQTERYAKIAKEHYKREDVQIYLIYYKMEEQCDYSSVQKAGFIPFSREMMISILSDYVNNLDEKGGNNIIIDYYDYLVYLDGQINGFKSLPKEEWGWYAWQGFLSTIHEKLGGEWDYVANPGGGFLGLWWHGRSGKIDDKEFEYYLQIEYDRLIFKLMPYDRNDFYELRDYFRGILFPMAKELKINIYKYGRIGTYPGVARYDGDCRVFGQDGKIDMDATFELLNKMEKLLDAVALEIK
jgi:hypothetical protein